MNFRTKNGFRDTQVVLKELNLYGGAIDGAWGSGTASSIAFLLRSYAEHMGRPLPDVNALPAKGGDDGSVAITALQQVLTKLGLYQGSIDGIWGNGTMGGLQTAFGIYVAKNRTPSYGLGWSKLVPPEFAQKVILGCTKRSYPVMAAHWLMGNMAFESGRTFSPSKQNNGGSNFFGLIQFGNAAALELDTTLEKLKAMTQLEQLDYVFKYFDLWQKRGKRYTQLEDFYLTIFYPAAVGKKADEVLFTQNSPDKFIAKAYAQNSGFDKNKDGAITIGEICTTVYDIYYQGMDTANRVVLS